MEFIEIKISPEIMAETNRMVEEIEKRRALRKSKEPQTTVVITKSEYEALGTIIDYLNERDIFSDECQDLCDLYNRVE